MHSEPKMKKATAKNIYSDKQALYNFSYGPLDTPVNLQGNLQGGWLLAAVQIVSTDAILLLPSQNGFDFFMDSKTTL